ncbi:MAG: tetraacyldisaccharide 4'-kinase, partial [Planctomycetota bacterium]
MTGRIARGLLALIEAPYAAAVRHRNRRYDRGAAETLSVPVPVISVGNLTLGGTGKTPMVKWIARWLANRGVRAALISRGYGGDRGGQNDEALELAQALPDTPHVQNADRVAAAHHAIREFGAEALLLDDAFQHRRIARDLNIVLLDATEPFGFGRVFPRGMLREPVEGLSRADVVCLTRSDLVDSWLRTRTRDEAMRLAPDAIWCEASHEPAGLITAKGDQRSLAELQGRRVAAFCGIGNPAAFRRTLEAAGCDVA